MSSHVCLGPGRRPGHFAVHAVLCSGRVRAADGALRTRASVACGDPEQELQRFVGMVRRLAALCAVTVASANAPPNLLLIVADGEALSKSRLPWSASVTVVSRRSLHCGLRADPLDLLCAHTTEQILGTATSVITVAKFRRPSWMV